MVNIPIFLSADNNYAPFVATTIASICDHTKSFCDFYILDGGITEENKAKICELKKQFDNFDIEFLQINLEKYFKNFPETNYISKAMYSRFLIPNLKPNIDKAIYSDVDVIVMGDIAEMYSENLEGYALGAVWEEYAEKVENVTRKLLLNLSDSHKYFCSGVLLLDCQKWRKLNILDKLFSCFRNQDSVLLCPDQDILNKYFENNYKILSAKYDFLNQSFFISSIIDILIRHFNGSIKPWHINPDIQTSLLPNKDDFWRYAKMTSFFEDLYQKTLNKQEQESLLRRLRLSFIVRKTKKDS